MEQLASINPVYDLGPLFDDCKYAYSDDKVVPSDSYIVNFIQSATESCFERGKHGFMHLNDVKFPRFMLKALKLHLFCLPMLVPFCFNNSFLMIPPCIGSGLDSSVLVICFLMLSFSSNIYLIC